LIIKFNHWNGKITVDAEIMILDMPMTNYRKWVKLFAQHGLSEDQQAFLQLLEDQIQANEQAIKDLEAEVNEYQMKAEGRVRTVLAPKYCREQMRLKQRHLNGARRMLKRRQSMRDILKGLIV